MSTPEELIASKLSVEKIAERLGADGVYYLSMRGLMEAAGESGFCAACFNKNYPVLFDQLGNVEV
jgi:amidophosphoribosyltransferase